MQIRLLIISIAILLSLLGFSIELSGQNRFVSGKIVNTQGDTLDVLIKKINNRINPSKIDYRIGNNKVLEGTPETIKMFQIKGEARHFGVEILVDESSDIHGQLTSVADPKWNKKQIFLKQVLSDSISLFVYKSKKILRFYYKTFESDNYEPLIHKKYISKQRVKHNRSYRKQLQGLFTCGTSFELLQKVDYKLKDLVIFFKAAGNCSEALLDSFDPDLKPVVISWKPILGVNLMSAELERTTFFGGRIIEEYSTESDKFNGIKIGASGSLPLSRKNERWSAILETSYENINFEGTWNNILHRTINEDFRDDQTLKVELHHIVVNLGLARYFKIQDNLSLFLSTTWSPGFTFDLRASTVVSAINNIPSTAASPELREVGNFNFNLGLAFNDFTVEFRSNTKRNLMGNSSVYRTRVSTFSFIAGYKF